MAALFYLLGLLGTLLGIAWLVVVLGSGGPTTAGAIAGRLLAAAPGLGVLFGGLVLLAIGGVLGRLDRIIHNTADVADALDDKRKAPKP